jgi:hypothetical protein
VSTETKPRKPRAKKTKALAAEIAGVQERVRGLATLPSERIEVARSASGKAANFRTHDDKQRRVMLASSTVRMTILNIQQSNN